MDKIVLKNLAFFGFHGVLKEENRLGQKFFVDLELYTDLEIAGSSDDINMSVNYAEVYDLVKIIVETRTYKLIEALAENITLEIFKSFELISGIKVFIKKPEAPVQGIFDYMGVEIERKRDKNSLLKSGQ